MTITLSSYNRRVLTVQDVKNLFTFATVHGNGRLSRVQAEATINGFKTVFFNYLDGQGHVPGTEHGVVTLEEYNLRKSEPLFRARVTLRQLTDSWLLPLGDSGIKVRFTPSEALLRSKTLTLDHPGPRTTLFIR